MFTQVFLKRADTLCNKFQYYLHSSRFFVFDRDIYILGAGDNIIHRRVPCVRSASFDMWQTPIVRVLDPHTAGVLLLRLAWGCPTRRGWVANVFLGGSETTWVFGTLARGVADTLEATLGRFQIYFSMCCEVEAKAPRSLRPGEKCHNLGRTCQNRR